MEEVFGFFEVNHVGINIIDKAFYDNQRDEYVIFLSYQKEKNYNVRLIPEAYLFTLQYQPSKLFRWLQSWFN